MALTTNILAYWTFDENSGVFVNDITNNGNQGTWKGTLGNQWAAGKINSGGNFNGTDNYSLCKSGAILSGLTNWSISLWFKTSLSSGSGRAIYCERAATGNDILKFDYANPATGLIQLTYRDDAGTLNQIATSTGYNNGVWRNGILTKNGTSVILYINGIQVNTGILTATNTFTNAGIESRIGGDAGDGAAYFSGNIDEVGLWSRTLTSSEASQIANNGLGLQYPFNPTLITSSIPSISVRDQIIISGY